jgi:hypothetical protein
VSAFAAAATAAQSAKARTGSGEDALQPLSEGQSPLTWIERLALPPHGFKPLKHRKFVESIRTSSPTEAAAWLRLTHDARIQDDDSAVAAGEKAIMTLADFASGTAAVNFDFHAFHSSVVPPPN